MKKKAKANKKTETQGVKSKRIPKQEVHRELSTRQKARLAKLYEDLAIARAKLLSALHAMGTDSLRGFDRVAIAMSQVRKFIKEIELHSVPISDPLKTKNKASRSAGSGRPAMTKEEWRSLKHRTIQSVHLVGTGQTRKPGGHRGSG